ncbi:unnamed protein product [Toxocara canis]|uniref:PH domain-containing protein n=1 Tax=Toxocara canis TaxID=6265 RepID=A0A183U0H6_TOXCA|nr:unnamed protein product [Toxocara canis]
MSTGGDTSGIFRRIYNRFKKRTDGEPEVGDSESSFDDIVRTIACSGNELKSGYLTKKRWKIGSFSRYFVLRDDAKFYYYKSQADSNIPQNYSGVVQLKDVYIMPHGTRIFTIHSYNGVWTLKARNGEERDEWIQKLKFARACMQAKEENELTQLVSGHSEHHSVAGFNASAIPDLDKRVKELIKCAATLTMRSTELSQSHRDARKSGGTKERMKDLSIRMSINFKNFKAAAKRYLQQSAAVQDYIRHTNDELRYVSEQRTNLIRQIETQEKQLRMIARSAKITDTGAIIEARVGAELARLDDSVIVGPKTDYMDSDDLSEYGMSGIDMDGMSVTGSDEVWITDFFLIATK